MPHTERYTAIVLDEDGNELSRVEGCSTVVLAVEFGDKSHIEYKGSVFAALGLLTLADTVVREELEVGEETL